jgi:hypothetical protein
MSLKHIRSGLLMVLSAFLLTISVSGWDDVGHKITSYIAWQRMTPEVRERVHKILMAAPEDSDIATFYVAGSRSEELRKQDHFVLMAYWADIVRDRSSAARFRNYHKANWHYYDKFWRVVDGKIEYIADPEDGGQALARLIEFDDVIRSLAPDGQKAVPIVWLMHLIGDIHQPLHASARVTDLESKGDQGGNLFLLTPQGTPRDKQENLHWLWDSIVVRNMPNSDNECDAEFISKMAEKFMKDHPYAKMQPRFAMGKYDQWAAESLELAQKEVFSADLKRFEMPSESYKKKALKIAEERLTLAGYRMGELFNDAFSAKPAVASASAIPCKIIRKVMYPVTHTSSVKQTLEIALLDLCPTNVAARPMMGFMADGKMVMKEYDVVTTFKTEAEARKYAAENNITDIVF